MTPLHSIGEGVREVLLSVPLWGARALFIALPTVVLLWVLRLPREETAQIGPNGVAGANLKWGAAATLLIQIAIYALL